MKPANEEGKSMPEKEQKQEQEQVGLHPNDYKLVSQGRGKVQAVGYQIGSAADGGVLAPGCRFPQLKPGCDPRYET
jgi:hypothetical protein